MAMNLEQHRGAEHEQGGVGGLPFLIGELGPFEAEAIGQILGGERLHGTRVGDSGEFLASGAADCWLGVHGSYHAILSA